MSSDTKISDLPDGGLVQQGDRLPLARAPYGDTDTYQIGLGNAAQLYSGILPGNLPALTSNGLPAVVANDTLVTDPSTTNQNSLVQTLSNIYQAGANVPWQFKPFSNGPYWNAATNTPNLNSSPPANSNNNYYIVSTAGTQFTILFNVGDLILAAGNAWINIPQETFTTAAGTVTTINSPLTTLNITNPNGPVVSVDVNIGRVPVYNGTGSTMNAFTAFTIDTSNGAPGGTQINIKPFSYVSGDTDSYSPYGILITPLLNDNNGIGLIGPLNTLVDVTDGSVTAGDKLYCDVNGALTVTEGDGTTEIGLVYETQGTGSDVPVFLWVNRNAELPANYFLVQNNTGSNIPVSCAFCANANDTPWTFGSKSVQRYSPGLNLPVIGISVGPLSSGGGNGVGFSEGATDIVLGSSGATAGDFLYVAPDGTITISPTPVRIGEALVTTLTTDCSAYISLDAYKLDSTGTQVQSNMAESDIDDPSFIVDKQSRACTNQSGTDLDDSIVFGVYEDSDIAQSGDILNIGPLNQNNEWIGAGILINGIDGGDSGIAFTGPGNATVTITGTSPTAGDQIFYNRDGSLVIQASATSQSIWCGWVQHVSIITPSLVNAYLIFTPNIEPQFLPTENNTGGSIPAMVAVALDTTTGISPSNPQSICIQPMTSGDIPIGINVAGVADGDKGRTLFKAPGNVILDVVDVSVVAGDTIFCTDVGVLTVTDPGPSGFKLGIVQVSGSGTGVQAYIFAMTIEGGGGPLADVVTYSDPTTVGGMPVFNNTTGAVENVPVQNDGDIWELAGGIPGWRPGGAGTSTPYYWIKSGQDDLATAFAAASWVTMTVPNSDTAATVVLTQDTILQMSSASETSVHSIDCAGFNCLIVAGKIVFDGVQDSLYALCDSVGGGAFYSKRTMIDNTAAANTGLSINAIDTFFGSEECLFLAGSAPQTGICLNSAHQNGTLVINNATCNDAILDSGASLSGGPAKALNDFTIRATDFNGAMQGSFVVDNTLPSSSLFTTFPGGFTSLTNGNAVRVHSLTGVALPTPLDANTVYYSRNIGGDEIYLFETYEDALSLTAPIVITADGDGTYGIIPAQSLLTCTTNNITTNLDIYLTTGTNANIGYLTLCGTHRINIIGTTASAITEWINPSDADQLNNNNYLLSSNLGLEGIILQNFPLTYVGSFYIQNNTYWYYQNYQNPPSGSFSFYLFIEDNFASGDTVVAKLDSNIVIKSLQGNGNITFKDSENITLYNMKCDDLTIDTCTNIKATDSIFTGAISVTDFSYFKGSGLDVTGALSFTISSGSAFVRFVDCEGAGGITLSGNITKSGSSSAAQYLSSASFTPTDGSADSLTFASAYATYQDFDGSATLTGEIVYPTTIGGATNQINGLPANIQPPSSKYAILSATGAGGVLTVPINIRIDSAGAMFIVNGITGAVLTNVTLSGNTIRFSGSYIIA